MANPTNTTEAFVPEFLIPVMFEHIFYGVFFWEFFTTLEYEWKAVRGHIPYRWTIWIYSVSRVACLMGVILSAVITDVTPSFNCQVPMYFQILFLGLAFVTASLLIVLRISAIWNRNKVVVAVAIGVWLVNVGFFIQDAAQLRVTHPSSALKSLFPTLSCGAKKSLSGRLVPISLAVTDIALLLIMIVGLFRMRRDGHATFGLAQLLWKQGVIWITLATVIEIPPAMSAILNLELRPAVVAYLLSFTTQELLIPVPIVMTISATRMHRSLVDFATPDVMHENFRESNVKFATSKQICAAPVPLNPMVAPVCNVFQQHPTRQMTNHGSSTDMDEDVYSGQNGSTIEEDVERSE